MFLIKSRLVRETKFLSIKYTKSINIIINNNLIFKYFLLILFIPEVISNLSFLKIISERVWKTEPILKKIKYNTDKLLKKILQYNLSIVVKLVPKRLLKTLKKENPSLENKMCNLKKRIVTDDNRFTKIMP